MPGVFTDITVGLAEGMIFDTHDPRNVMLRFKAILKKSDIMLMKLFILKLKIESFTFRTFYLLIKHF